ncbi:MAG: ATP-binding protein, partial [Caldilinea sp. CFX5]|nr:ATP-binding protein [Caldilinea sp. CFX5]
MAVFKARARALDMLGRQQIAGVPTAISELFKNAHDAYADRVEVDYFRQMDLFLLRDDGLGMSLDDVESRWLTIGTESKLREAGRQPPSDTTKPLRPIMGEKGIGRLAIAAIGPQVLLLTRAKRSTELTDLIAAFIHWGFFEIPGVDLDRIHIPVRTFPGGTLPTSADISGMIEEVRQNLENLAPFAGDVRRTAIEKDLLSFNIDPIRFDRYLLGPGLSVNGHGTHFYISPTYNETLVADIEESDKNDSAAKENSSSMVKTLLGFTNTMTPNHAPPVIKTAFRYHNFSEIYKDILEASEFFTPENYINADHYINGTFDDYGCFTGTISIYGTEFMNEIIRWSKSNRRITDCGPFSIEIGYVAGDGKDSTLPKDDFLRIGKKLDKYGGLYIYRDNLRILPYGDSDFDWLDIEKRRSQNLGRYFFSYRRMFGAISISHKHNENLSEKAGREGFRDNKAYRQFRDILKNFFIQVAASFFRDKGEQSDVFFTRRSELNKLRTAMKQRDAIARSSRAAFEQHLDRAFQNLGEVAPRQQVESIVSDATKAMESIVLDARKEDVDNQLSEIETIAKQKIRNLREQFRVNVPPGLGLTPELRRQYSAYTQEIDKLEREAFQQGMNRIETVFQEAVILGSVAIDQRGRIRKALETAAADARQEINKEVQSVRRAIDSTTEKVVSILKRVESEFNDAVSASFNEVNQIDVVKADEANIIEQRIAVEENLLVTAEKLRQALRTLATQLIDVQWAEDENVGVVQTADMTAALEEEVLALRERADTDLELVQLGMAIEVINHEFTHTVEAIRTALRRLKAWADANERLKVIYQELRANFDHLDGYLTLFTPLHRRLYRTKIEFSGNDIATYLLDLFRIRLAKHEITIEPGAAFGTYKIIGYPSTIYPVFVNLVDNAIYWLQDYKHPRIIRLNVEGDQFIVSDTGPGISIRDRDAIFDQGFTRKPGGRGLGLFIARDVLSKVGYSLTLDEPQANQGATFRITPL